MAPPTGFAVSGERSSGELLLLVLVATGGMMVAFSSTVEDDDDNDEPVLKVGCEVDCDVVSLLLASVVFSVSEILVTPVVVVIDSVLLLLSTVLLSLVFTSSAAKVLLSLDGCPSRLTWICSTRELFVSLPTTTFNW